MKFSIKDSFSKLQIWSHLLKKPLMENFIFCAVLHDKSRFLGGFHRRHIFQSMSREIQNLKIN